MNLLTVLKAIGSTEASTFDEFCEGLEGDKPEQGDKDGWREILQTVAMCERERMVLLEREDGKIKSLILTEKGAAMMRAQVKGVR